MQLAPILLLPPQSALHVLLDSTMVILIPALLAATAAWDTTRLEAPRNALLAQMDIMTTIMIQLHRVTIPTWYVVLDITCQKAITPA